MLSQPLVGGRLGKKRSKPSGVESASFGSALALPLERGASRPNPEEGAEQRDDAEGEGDPEIENAEVKRHAQQQAQPSAPCSCLPFLLTAPMRTKECRCSASAQAGFVPCFKLPAERRLSPTRAPRAGIPPVENALGVLRRSRRVQTRTRHFWKGKKGRASRESLELDHNAVSVG